MDRFSVATTVFSHDDNPVVSEWVTDRADKISNFLNSISTLSQCVHQAQQLAAILVAELKKNPTVQNQKQLFTPLINSFEVQFIEKKRDVLKDAFGLPTSSVFLNGLTGLQKKVTKYLNTYVNTRLMNTESERTSWNELQENIQAFKNKANETLDILSKNATDLSKKQHLFTQPVQFNSVQELKNQIASLPSRID